MIVSLLKGGLGNQMFQYAVGRALALENHSELKLDLSFLQNRSSEIKYTIRDFELGVFNYKAKIASEGELKKFYDRKNSRFHRRVSKYLPGLDKLKIFSESDLGFNQKVAEAKGDVYLDGFWQSEKYFKRHFDVIVKEFTFINEPTAENLILLKEIAGGNSVSLHVRRGDMANDPHTSAYHGTVSKEYYLSAINYLKERIGDFHLFIFSDEPSWVKTNFEFNVRHTYVSHNVGKQNYEDMRLMSKCHHNIIANSSFSWWGAYLNPNHDKIVIAPKRWLNNTSVNTSDILPTNWVRL